MMSGVRQVRPSCWAALVCAAALVLTLVGCATEEAIETIAKEAEEAAIVELLYEESRFAIAGDLEELLALYVQDETNTRLSVTKTVSAMITGWDEVRAHQENLLSSSWADWEDKEGKCCRIQGHGDRRLGGCGLECRRMIIRLVCGGGSLDNGRPGPRVAVGKIDVGLCEAGDGHGQVSH